MDATSQIQEFENSLRYSSADEARARGNGYATAAEMDVAIAARDAEIARVRKLRREVLEAARRQQADAEFRAAGGSPQAHGPASISALLGW